MNFTPGVAGGGGVSELVLRTTQLPNGQQSTFTSFAVVGGATPTRGSGGTGKTSGNPSLQSGLAAPTGRCVGEMAALVGGAIGAAAAML